MRFISNKVQASLKNKFHFHILRGGIGLSILAAIFFSLSTLGLDGGYADSGTGDYINNIYWFTWENGDLANGIHENDTKTFSLPGGGQITATFTGVNAGAATYLPHDMETWSGAKSHNYYQLNGSNGEALYGAEGNDATFTITFSATLNGTSYTPDLIFLDPESTDAGEEISVHTNGTNWQVIETLGSGQVNLSLDIPDDFSIFDGASGNPLLLSRDATEIEVYVNAGGRQAVTFGLWFGLDFGDAPNTYATDNMGNGPKHLVDILTPLHLGNTVDIETDGVSGGTGIQDGGDEDGIILPASIEVGTNYTISASDITVTNQIGTTASLHAWIDFDGDGHFDSDEYASTTISNGTANGNPTGSLSWIGIGDWVDGLTYARFRITTDPSISASTPGGFAADGEVEDYSITMTNPPFPVEWLDLNAVWNNEEALIKWTTAQETNTDYFQIERKNSLNDDFTPLGEIQASGNSSQAISYQYSDHQIETTLDQASLTYRIKQVDIDGSFEYSRLIELKSKDLNNSRIIIFPNPASLTAQVQLAGSIDQDQSYLLTVYNHSGQIVYKESILPNNIAKLNVESWATGTYIVNVSLENQSFTKNLVVQ